MKKINLEGEVWKPIKGYEGIYEISNMGRVWSVPRWRQGKRTRLIGGHFISPGNKRGYLAVYFKNKFGFEGQWYVHVLVALHFIPNPHNYPEVNHNNPTCDRSLNRADMLEWTTSSENIRHAGRCGRLCRGERHHSAKLSTRQAIYIKRRLKKSSKRGLMKQLASYFNVSIPAIAAIKTGRSYGYLEI